LGTSGGPAHRFTQGASVAMLHFGLLGTSGGQAHRFAQGVSVAMLHFGLLGTSGGQAHWFAQGVSVAMLHWSSWVRRAFGASVCSGGQCGNATLVILGTSCVWCIGLLRGSVWQCYIGHLGYIVRLGASVCSGGQCGNATLVILGTSCVWVHRFAQGGSVTSSVRGVRSLRGLLVCLMVCVVWGFRPPAHP